MYMNSERKTSENMTLLLNESGDLMTEDRENTNILEVHTGATIWKGPVQKSMQAP